MRRFFGTLKNEYIYLEDDEFLHAKNVLRLKEGDEIIVSVNDDYDYLAKIEIFDKKSCKCKLIEKRLNQANPKYNIELFIGTPKGDKLDLVTQKAVELGASKITPFNSNFTNASLNENKLNRLNKISKEACKQCGRSKSVIVNPEIKFERLIDRLSEFDVVIFAYEKAEEKFDLSILDDKQNIGIIVGSEGGFSQNESQKIKSAGAIEISLGKRILRAETAPLFLLSVISHYKGN